jgi:hypothetical protein
VPTEAEVSLDWTATSLNIEWVTNIDSRGVANLARGAWDRKSEYEPLDIKTWDQYKSYVSELGHYHFIYRGQPQIWRLRTPFHRTGRGDLRTFFGTDVPISHRHLSGRLKHVFDLTQPLQDAAFLNLVQHHGYPTPLLDWTYSPYIAAYFAYSRAKAKYVAAKAKVRIFIFDRVEWCAAFQQMLHVGVRVPHFSIVGPISIGNERMIPQQALSSYATVDDIESYIRSRETDTKRYLRVIDLPLIEREKVMRELSLMGITAGSLFTGIDGACEELKARFFRT